MSYASIIQLLDAQQVRSLLNIDDDDLQWLVNAGRLPSVRIHDKLRFDAADVVRFVTTSKNVQYARYCVN